jgi:hypothetical protein
MPEDTPEEIESKVKAYKSFIEGEGVNFLKAMADTKVAQFFIPKTDENKDVLITDGDFRHILSGHKDWQDIKVAKAKAVALEERIFHWFIEFPEVFNDGGFDCILGNPPFLGGSKLSGTFGYPFLEYLRYNYSSSGGLCDLVGYFFRRIFSIISNNSFTSLISTNSICQGDTKEASLDYILANNGLINFAVKSQKWPGNAAVEVSLISIIKITKEKQRKVEFSLNGKKVNQINSYLDDSEYSMMNHRLISNEGISYNGSSILGKGFFLDKEEYNNLLKIDNNNSKILFPVINGDEVNNNYKLDYTRFVINFFDWDLSYCENYPSCLNIVKERVLPERLKQNDKGAKEKWWQYLRPRTELYEKLKSKKKCLSVALTSKTLAFDFLPTNIIYTHAVGLFVNDTYSFFAILQSNFHSIWAWKFGSTMKSDLRYTSSDIFENYPFPQNLNLHNEQNLETIGESYHQHRKQLMLGIQLGLTKTYNLFHSNAITNQFINNEEKQVVSLQKHLEKTNNTISLVESIEGILKLRDLHVKMDLAVLDAYGWNDIQLRHDFYEVDYLPENDRIRYSIHSDARKEVLKRLLELNHKIHEEETQVQINNPIPKKKSKTAKVKNQDQSELF